MGVKFYLFDKFSMLYAVMELCDCFCNGKVALLWWSKLGLGDRRQGFEFWLARVSYFIDFARVSYFILRSSVK